MYIVMHIAATSSDTATTNLMLPGISVVQGSDKTPITPTTIIMPSPTNIFVRLPLELRDRVYRLLLEKDSPIRLSLPRYQTCPVDLTYRTRTPCDSGVGVLWLCKQIQAEAIAVFFRYNTFRVEAGYSLKAFVDFIPREKRVMVRKVELQVNLCQAFSPAAVERETGTNAAYRSRGVPVSAARFRYKTFINDGWNFDDIENTFSQRFNLTNEWRFSLVMFGDKHPGLYLGTTTDIASFRSFYKSTASAFPGMQELDICLVRGDSSTNFIARSVELAKDETVKELVEMLRLFSHAPGSQVRRIGMKDDASTEADQKAFLDDVMVECVLPVFEGQGEGEEGLCWDWLEDDLVFAEEETEDEDSLTGKEVVRD